MPCGKKKKRAAICSICGKRTTNIFKHRWQKHPKAARKSLNKAQKTRKKNKRKKGRQKR